MFWVLLPLANAAEGDPCEAEEAVREPTRRTPLPPPVETGLPTRPRLPGEQMCPVFVEGDAVDVRCEGNDDAVVSAASRSWYSLGPIGLLVWVGKGKATGVYFPSTLSWTDLNFTVHPVRTSSPDATWCRVRLLVGADGIPIAARAKSACTAVEGGERLAMTARFDPPCIGGANWPAQIDVRVSVP